MTGIALFVTSLLVIVLFPRKPRTAPQSAGQTETPVARGELAVSSSSHD